MHSVRDEGCPSLRVQGKGGQSAIEVSWDFVDSEEYRIVRIDTRTRRVELVQLLLFVMLR